MRCRVSPRSSYGSRQPCVSTDEPRSHIVIRSCPCRVVRNGVPTRSGFIADVFGYWYVKVRECCSESEEEDEGNGSASAREDGNVDLGLEVSASRMILSQ